MKQLLHVKVGGSSYFIEGDSVIYASNDGVKYVCGNQLLQIYGYPEGLGSFTEPNFLKIGGKLINKDRIIAYTNTGVAVNTGTQYFETINYSNASEFNNLQKYFDPTDSTDIDGWNIVKDKVCSFQPGSSNINGQIAEDIKPVTPTPPGPTPGEVVVRMTELVDDSWSRVTTITKQNSIYRMFMTVEGTDDPVGYVRNNLIFAWGGVDMETPGFAVSDHHTATEDIMVEFWTSTLRDEFMNNGVLEVYMVERLYPDRLVFEIPATIEATPVVPVNITSVNLSPNVVTENGTYNLTIMTDNYSVPVPGDVINQHLSVSINGKGSVTRDNVYFPYPGTYTCNVYISDLQPDFGGNLSVYISGIDGGNDYSVEFPIQEPQQGLVITRAGWDDSLGGFSVKVNNEGDFTSELRARLSTDCTDMDSSYYAQIKNITQTGMIEYYVFLNNWSSINGTVYLYDNGVQIAEHNFSPEPGPEPGPEPTGPQPQTGSDADIPFPSEVMFTPGEYVGYSFYKDYGDASINIKTAQKIGSREFGASYHNESFWNIPNSGDVNTKVFLPGTNPYAIPGTSEPQDGEMITIYNFALWPTGPGHQLQVNISLTDYDYIIVENNKWVLFEYSTKGGWRNIQEGSI